MKLYCDPISTTSRPVMLFIADHAIDCELVHVDLMSGAQRDPAYLALNPNGIVPFLVDGDFAMGESSAILRYLAEKVGSPAYPTGLRERSKVNEALDWFATNFHEYFCLMAVYPHMGVPLGADPMLLEQMLAFGEEKAPKWLEILDRHMLGDRPYVCGETMSLADYLGGSFVSLGELAAFDFSPYPNVVAWLERLKARPAWAQTYAGFYGLVTALRSQAALSA